MTRREELGVFTFAVILTFIAMWASAHYAFKVGLSDGWNSVPHYRLIPATEWARVGFKGSLL